MDSGASGACLRSPLWSERGLEQLGTVQSRRRYVPLGMTRNSSFQSLSDGQSADGEARERQLIA